MKENYKLAVYIGRFQPYHNGHKYVIEEALKKADKVLILLGSSNSPRTPKNPFDSVERAEAIKVSFPQQRERLITTAIYDHTYDENRWLEQIQDRVHVYEKDDTNVVMVGYDRDHTSYYLEKFPQWDTFYTDEHHHRNEPINGTALRNSYFRDPQAFFKNQKYMEMMPNSSCGLLQEFFMEERFQAIKEWWKFNQYYKNLWAGSPFPVIFQTVDACVIQSGHMLLIQRGADPGKGLWALPGGYLDEYETLVDGCIRELREETRLHVPEKVLRGSITYSKEFDHPTRSERGRVITNCFMFELNDEEKLPRVYGSDDAAKAQWFPIRQVEEMSNVLFEDHYHIATHMIRRSK